MGLASARAGVAPLPRPPKALVVANTSTRPKTLRERFSKGAVEWSPDLERVLKLPYREKPDLTLIADGLTAVLKKPEGTQRLRDIQAWALWEATQAGGLLAPLATGAGKTLIGCLMLMVWGNVKQEDGSSRPPRGVLFLPPDLRSQFHADWERYGKHWRLPNLAGGKWFQPGLPVLHVIAYSELSHTKSSALLLQIDPDVIMGDEISALRNFETARVRRMRHFFEQKPDTRFCGWDATITSDSIENFWHLLVWALGEGAPVPIEHSELRRWARAIDPTGFDDGYYMPGELMKFCQPGESVRSGFQRRLVGTLGVVATEENQLGIPLIFRERRPPPMPEKIVALLKTLRRKPTDGGWKRPDGEEFREMTEVVACARQLASGCWMKWVFPRGEPKEVRDDWFLKRQNWNRELRAVLARPMVHMDSPKLCENAAERWFAGGCTGCARGPREDHQPGCRDVESHPLWDSYTFLPWRAVEDTVFHKTETVWESDWLLEDAAAWAREAPGIVWVDHPEFGHRLEKMTGFRYYGGGETANEEILDVDGTESIVCSVASNKRGKNLQCYSRNLIVSFPASNDIVEQLVGRSYRSGQNADCVTVDYYLHTAELENAFEKAKGRAEFVSETMGTAQKLCYAKFERAA